MSTHFKRTLVLLPLLASALTGGYFWLKHRIYDSLVPPHVVLPANDKEIVTYNENRHILTVTTATGTTRQYSRSPEVEIRKDGTIKIDANKWGLEARPFLGIGYSDTLRAYIGCNAFYFHQLDLGVGAGAALSQERVGLRPTLSVGYNFWSNSSINVGINPIALATQKTEIAVFLSVKL